MKKILSAVLAAGMVSVASAAVDDCNGSPSGKPMLWGYTAMTSYINANGYVSATYGNLVSSLSLQLIPFGNKCLTNAVCVYSPRW